MNFKKISFCSFLIIAALFIVSCQKNPDISKNETSTSVDAPIPSYKGFVPELLASYIYSDTNEAFVNPLCGFAPRARIKEFCKNTSLVYIDITWREFEPHEGVFDYDALVAYHNIDLWKSEGKHAVFRFICDTPRSKPHIDIPDWLYEKTNGDGYAYSYDDGNNNGYSPNYENPVFIEYHAKAIAALGKYFGSDTFVSYVELGSLGHYGEWNVKYYAGVPYLPLYETRKQYILPYISAFPNAKMLLRRSFREAKDFGFGLYNDVAGDKKETERWLDWIKKGGDFNSANEKNALVPMPNAWKSSPMGGELGGPYQLVELLESNKKSVIEQISLSHTTFLGPKYASPLSESNEYANALSETSNAMGYRIGVRSLNIYSTKRGNNVTALVEWFNTGVAPMYFNWNIFFYFADNNGEIIKKIPIALDLVTLLPQKSIVTYTDVPIELYNSCAEIRIGIEDPLTGKPAVMLAFSAERNEKTSKLFIRS